VICTFADVTKSVEPEQRLREERDGAQHCLELASTLGVVLDARGLELINREDCDPGSTAIVSAVPDLGAALGMTTVVGRRAAGAAGVLRTHGCPLVQGLLDGETGA